MAGSTNFLVWNPSQSNQESDAAYAADAQRSGGATNDSAFPSPTANKLFYQTSTGITALMQMMATKGFTVNDTNVATLASVLAALLTTADIRPNLQSIPYAASITCSVSQALGFQIPLNGNTSITITGVQVGDLITFIFTQDSTGGRTVAWPSNVDVGLQPNPTPNSVSVITYKANASSNLELATPTMTDTGINSTPVGASTPSTGRFTTPLASDNSTNAATTAWAKLGFLVSLGTSGYVKFPTWLGGFILQWANGVSQSDSSETQTINLQLAFPTACFSILPGSTASSFNDTEMPVFVVISNTLSSVVVAMQRVPDHGFVAATPTVWAIGN